MQSGLPFPDAVTDLQTYANTAYEARLTLLGLALLQLGAVAIWSLTRPARAESGAPWARLRWVVLPLVAGSCFGAAGAMLGHLLDPWVGGADSKDLLPLAFLVGSLSWLAAHLARSSETRPMARLQLASALVWLAYPLAWGLAAGRFWDDLFLQLPLVIPGTGALVAAVFVGCRRRAPARPTRDMFDTRWARRLAAGVAVAFALGIAGLLVDEWLDATRPWRNFAKPIASLHVWNQSMAEVDVSFRPVGDPTWTRLQCGRVGPSAYGYSWDEATPIYPGEREWTYRDTADGRTEPFDLAVTSFTGPDRIVLVPGVVLGEAEHLRLRVDDEGRVWMSRGGEGWLHAALFGDETELIGSR